MKKFYSFQELADIENCNAKVLVDLAAQNLFPVFISANNWYGHTWKKLNPSNDSLNDDYQNQEDINFGEWILDTPLEKPIQLNNSLLLLKASSLVSYQLNNIANVASFEAGDAIKGPDEYSFEFRLCNPLDFSKPYEINLKDHALVVMNDSLPRIRKLLLKKTEQELSTLTDSEQTKLLKIIGALALVITKSSNKYTNGVNPNVSQISEAILQAFSDIEKSNQDIFEKKGMGSTNLKDAITAGLKKLHNT